MTTHMMELSSTVAVYGHTFSLNVAVENGMNWNNTGPAYKHFCRIELGDDHAQALLKAKTIKAAFGSEYEVTLMATPVVASSTFTVEV